MFEEEASKSADNRQELIGMSIAISLKRIADLIEGRPDKLGFIEHLSGAMQDAIYNAVSK